MIYVITEKGERYGEKRTTDPDVLLFWLISDLTFSMAGDYELTHRNKNEDSRRQLFSKDLELLASINPEWAKWMKEKYDKILIEHPFNDNRD